MIKNNEKFCFCFVWQSLNDVVVNKKSEFGLWSEHVRDKKSPEILNSYY